MDRRRFLLTSLAGVLATPLAAEAQRVVKVYRIGFLGTTVTTPATRKRSRKGSGRGAMSRARISRSSAGTQRAGPSASPILLPSSSGSKWT